MIQKYAARFRKNYPGIYSNPDARFTNMFLTITVSFLRYVISAGGNLGIVTSFTVKINPLASLPTVTTMHLSASYDNAAALFDAVSPNISLSTSSAHVSHL